MTAGAGETARLLLAVEDSRVTPGVLGFLVVALLGVATYLLIRSMNRQIRRIDLPEEPAEPARDPDPGPAPGSSGDSARPDDAGRPL